MLQCVATSLNIPSVTWPYDIAVLPILTLGYVCPMGVEKGERN